LLRAPDVSHLPRLLRQVHLRGVEEAPAGSLSLLGPVALLVCAVALPNGGEGQARDHVQDQPRYGGGPQGPPPVRRPLPAPPRSRPLTTRVMPDSRRMLTSWLVSSSDTRLPVRIWPYRSRRAARTSASGR